jgi:hypothetical protein
VKRDTQQNNITVMCYYAVSFMASVTCAKCRKYAQYAECRYAECRSAI